MKPSSRLEENEAWPPTGLSAGPLPLHFKVERALRDLIAASNPGDLLPPEIQLADELGVSRTTIRQALDRLATAGVIVRTAGRGTQVVDRHIETQLDFTPFVKALEATGHKVRTASAEVNTRPADDDEAAALGLNTGTPVRVLRRVRLVDEVPFALLITVLGARVALPKDLKGSLYEWLEVSGTHLSRLSDVVTSGGASEEIAKALGLRRGSAILMIRRTAYDDLGEPVEFTRAFLRSSAGYVVEHKR
jgi:GntR family transcriptional regulator